jgi:hypothetical protein
MICVFAEYFGEDGWGKVNAISHQPDKLTDEMKVRGVLCEPMSPPEVRDGWNPSMYVNKTQEKVEWRIEVDKEYKAPASEILGLLPLSVRVAAREAAKTDAVLSEWFVMLDASVADNASTGFHPASPAIVEGVDYMLAQGIITEGQRDSIVRV